MSEGVSQPDQPAGTAEPRFPVPVHAAAARTKLTFFQHIIRLHHSRPSSSAGSSREPYLARHQEILRTASI